MFFKSIFQCILCMLEGSGALLLLLLFTYVRTLADHPMSLHCCTGSLYVHTIHICITFFRNVSHFSPVVEASDRLHRLLHDCALANLSFATEKMRVGWFWVSIYTIYSSMCAICTIVVELLRSSSALKDMGVDCHSAHEQQEMDGRVVSVY